MKLPRKPLKPCKFPGCPDLTVGSYCEQHQEQADHKPKRRAYNKLYGTTRWQALRQNVLSKQPLCIQCMKSKRIRPATVVDHIDPHKGCQELFYDESNLQSLCKPCHDRKTAQEDGRWKRSVYTY